MYEYPDTTTVELESGQVWCNDGDNFYIVVQNLDTSRWNAIWLSRGSRNSTSLQMYSTMDEWKTKEDMIEWIEDDVLVAATGNMWRDIDKWLAKEI